MVVQKTIVWHNLSCALRRAVCCCMLQPHPQWGRHRQQLQRDDATLPHYQRRCCMGELPIFPRFCYSTHLHILPITCQSIK